MRPEKKNGEDNRTGILKGKVRRYNHNTWFRHPLTCGRTPRPTLLYSKAGRLIMHISLVQERGTTIKGVTAITTKVP